jgi:hypothetical protein
MTTSPYSTTPRRPASLWALLLVAMVLAQSLGLMHGVIHTAPLNAERHVPSVHGDVHEHAARSWLADLYAAHHHESDCRLYDQFSHGDCVPAMAILWIPLLATPAFLKVFEAPSPLTHAALVQARGPPLLR